MSWHIKPGKMSCCLRLEANGLGVSSKRKIGTFGSLLFCLFSFSALGTLYCLKQGLVVRSKPKETRQVSLMPNSYHDLSMGGKAIALLQHMSHVVLQHCSTSPWSQALGATVFLMQISQALCGAAYDLWPLCWDHATSGDGNFSHWHLR